MSVVAVMARAGSESLGDASRKPLVVAAIPCFNEERFIGSVVLAVKRHADQVVVVDDGSSDDSAEIAAAAIGLDSLKEPCEVRLMSDSRYVVETMGGTWKPSPASKA